MEPWKLTCHVLQGLAMDAGDCITITLSFYLIYVLGLCTREYEHHDV